MTGSQYRVDGHSKPDGQNDIERAGLSELSEQGGSGPGSYIYLKPGQTPGNVLIEIKSGKIKGNPTLWSWHIWIVDKYPTVLEVGKYGGDGAETVQLMSHLLGPTRRLIHSIVKVRIRNSACNTNGAGKTRSRHMMFVSIKTFMTAVASYLISFGNREEMMWIMEKQMLSKREGLLLR